MEDKKRKYNSSQQQAGASRPRNNHQQGPQSRPAYQSGNQGQQQNVRYSNQSQQTSQRYNNNQVQRPASQAPRQNAPAPSGSRQNSNTVPMKPNVNPAPTGNTCFKCGQLGHYANACPQRQKNNNNNGRGGGTSLSAQPPRAAQPLPAPLSPRGPPAAQPRSSRSAQLPPPSR
ncbi:basic salivary proline-rich protein 4-like [Sorghum bicolor]|uniref:basic salivary proline-rich protein 4-like n=1 Tax=Sorghum bicolor TaxID=4558 RepID=UPI000B426A6D|nr:basic salivary proline-rich protein 4-like [Sorghum bicolor]|eukprot:XP_021315201.1 basic salivary proline-rich protein 4-like [Sorghum bicolor]